MTSVQVKQLFTYPVKGLTPQVENYVDLQAGHGIPGDRAFALMYEGSSNQASPVVPWMKKQNFAMQCNLPELAALACHYNSTTKTLTVKRQGAELLVADTDTPSGRDRLGAFFTGYITATQRSGRSLRFVGDRNGKTRYPDREAVHLSLLSVATINELSEVAENAVDVRRFRPNVVLDSVPAWAEFDWVGGRFQLGQAQIDIVAPINRCLNIDVNPDTGEQDIPLLSLLKKHFGHRQTGVLAKVITNGRVNVGDRLIFAHNS